MMTIQKGLDVCSDFVSVFINAPNRRLFVDFPSSSLVQYCVPSFAHPVRRIYACLTDDFVFATIIGYFAEEEGNKLRKKLSVDSFIHRLESPFYLALFPGRFCRDVAVRLGFFDFLCYHGLDFFRGKGTWCQEFLDLLLCFKRV